ncbi:MAG: GTP cyclohydrolase I FolE [Thermoleophilia bacterium]
MTLPLEMARSSLVTTPGMDLAKIEEGIRLVLEGLGEDTEREGLLRTPRRVAEMYQDVLHGTHQDLASIIEVMPSDKHQELVLIKDIPFHSICEHHLTPFFGVAHVAYIPSKCGKITGLSKLARLVKVAAARLQLQERLTSTIADTLVHCLDPEGVLVLVQAEHLCMSMRGVRTAGALTVTSAVRGIFRTNSATRAEVLALIEAPKR